jgi:hypothetical protein
MLRPPPWPTRRFAAEAEAAETAAADGAYRGN